MRTPRFASGALVLAVLATASRGAGTITTAGATITAGTGSPAGTVTTDAAARAGLAPAIPPVGTLGTIGTFSSQLPAFPGGGTGADGAFTASGAVAGISGTFNYTTFTVNAGASVTYSGSTTIRTTGDVVLDGPVTSSTVGSSITFVCGGSFSIGAAGKVETTASASPVLLDVAGGFTGAVGAKVNAKGDAEVRTHGGNVALPGTTLRASFGNLTVRSSGGITESLGATLDANGTGGGSLLVQAFGGDVALSTPATLQATSGTGSIAIEASQNATFSGGSSSLAAGDGTISISAFGGDVKFLAGGSIEGATGGVHVRASGGIRRTGGVRLDPGGPLTLTAFGGDVDVQPSGGGLTFDTGGDLTLEASGSVLLDGVDFRSATRVLLRALGDRVLLNGAIVDGMGPLLDVRAANRIVADTGVYNADVVSLSAGAGGFTGGLAQLNAHIGDFNLTTLGPVSLGGGIVGQADISITSCDAGVTILPGVEVRTGGKTAGGTSGKITIQSFADTAGVIDVSGSTIASGNSQNGTAGDVRLIVHQGKIGGGGGEKIDAKTPSKSKLTVTGTIDLGSSPPDLAAPPTFRAGPLEIDFGAPVTKGKKRVYSATGAVLVLTPDASGRSHVAFSLTRTGDLAGVPADGEIDPTFSVGAFVAKGAIVLTKGKYALGRIRGGLIIPCVYVGHAAVTESATAGKDKLTLSMGFDTGEGPLLPVSDFTLTFGGGFAVTIPKEQFTRKGLRDSFKGNVLGTRTVVIDHAKGTVSVTGKEMDLGTLPAATGPVTVSVVFGRIDRANTVVMSRTGAKLTY
jgi:uncharacterized protein (DUF2345 family)